ncbi:type II secretion system protein GspM [uncultured Paludibaculum sp.]|uniref:type II secretion system protein GspM n=1 Tax=uncultured Paludibaculum sp. TaxID=1765020 RepID=UPI002AABCA1E|nr:type II secretion system protein GspM [uncultured Paludibaculum sp.]
MKQLSSREKQALILWPIGVAVILAIYYWPAPNTGVIGVVNSVQADEKRVTKLRRLSAAEPSRQEVLKKVSAELGRREKGLIQADSAPLAQAQLLQIVRRVAQLQPQALLFKSTEFAAPRPFGNAYGEVVMTVNLECGIEQVVNLLADISNQPELISVADVQFSQVLNKQKVVPVRITFTGIVPRKLVPEKKGGNGL